jgi:hypothetical protein
MLASEMVLNCDALVGAVLCEPELQGLGIACADEVISGLDG